MYAVVVTGGKQYRVSPGDTIDVEKLAGEVGQTVSLTPVMMVGQGAEVTIGHPVLTEARVEAQILSQKRGKKLIIFKHKRRKGYRRKQGHRQSLTALKIIDIHTATASLTAAESAAPMAAVLETAPAPEAIAVPEAIPETEAVPTAVAAPGSETVAIQE